MHKIALIMIIFLGIPGVALAQQQTPAGAVEESTSGAQPGETTTPDAGTMEQGAKEEGGMQTPKETDEGKPAESMESKGQPEEPAGPKEVIPDSSERALADADVQDLDCDQLWIARNEIFDRNGYCFRTKRGQDYFDNSDCTSDSQDILSQLEWENVKLIQRWEGEKGCR